MATKLVAPATQSQASEKGFLTKMPSFWRQPDANTVNAAAHTPGDLLSANSSIWATGNNEPKFDESAAPMDGPSREEVENTRMLFDYLSLNASSVTQDTNKMQTFGKLVNRCLEDLPADSRLADILHEFGWSGMKFMHIVDINFTLLQQAIGTHYMTGKQKVAMREATTARNKNNNMNMNTRNGNNNAANSLRRASTGIAMGSPMARPTTADRDEVSGRHTMDGMSGGGGDQVAANAAYITPVESVASFCPDTLMALLLNQTRIRESNPCIPSNAPFNTTFNGVSLLADISGFTKLSSNFCLRGSSGLDDLHAVTSGFLGRVVRIVYWFNGDVISFAGDALVCVFPDPGSRERRQQHLREKSAAHSNIEGVNDPEPSSVYNGAGGTGGFGGRGLTATYFLKALYAALCLVCCETAELTAHAALSYGEMSMATLGGHNNEWTYLLNGPCISELACIDDAKSREVVITPKLYNLLKKIDSNDPNAQENAVASSLAPSLQTTVVEPKHGTRLTGDNSDYVSVARNEAMGEVVDAMDDADAASTSQLSGRPGSVASGASGTRPPMQGMPHQPMDVVDFANSNIELLPSGNFLVKSLHVTPPVLSQALLPAGYAGVPLANSGKHSGVGDTSITSGVAAAKSFVMPTKSNPMLQLRAIDRCSTQDMIRRRYEEHSVVFAADENLELLTPFVPLTMTSYAAEDDANGGIVAANPELREVTTVFVKLDSYSHQEHVDPLSLQPFFLLAQETLIDCDGFLRQFLVDDKGCVLIAMWGVPSFTFPNNASRAIMFAKTLLNRCKTELDYKCSFGITTGNVYCGTIGTIIRRDYVAIGHTVNLSARLMGKAKGRILVDESTWRMLPSEARHHLVEGEDLLLKGTAGVTRPYVVDMAITEDIRMDIIPADVAVGGLKEPIVKKDVAIVLLQNLDLIADAGLVALREKGRRNPVTGGAQVVEGGRGGAARSGQGDSSASVTTSPHRFSNSPGITPVSLTYGNGISASTFGGAIAGKMARLGKEGALPPGGDKDRHLQYLDRFAVGGLSPHSTTSAVSPTAASVSKVSYLLLRGAAGMGKTTAGKFARFGAKRRFLRSIFVQSQSGDQFVPHKMIKSVIVQLIGEAYFQGEEKQIQIIRFIIRAALPQAGPDDVRRFLHHIGETLDLRWKESAIESSVSSMINSAAVPVLQAGHGGMGQSGGNSLGTARPQFGVPGKSRNGSILKANSPPNELASSGAWDDESSFVRQRTGGKSFFAGLSAGALAASGTGKGKMPSMSAKGPRTAHQGSGGVRASFAAVAGRMRASFMGGTSDSSAEGGAPSGGGASMAIAMAAAAAAANSYGSNSPPAKDSSGSFVLEKPLKQKPSRSNSIVGSTAAPLQFTLQDLLLILLLQKRTVIIVDDAHHCDELSLTELYLLHSKKLPLCVILTKLSTASSNAASGGGQSTYSAAPAGGSSGATGNNGGSMLRRGRSSTFRASSTPRGCIDEGNEMGSDIGEPNQATPASRGLRSPAPNGSGMSTSRRGSVGLGLTSRTASSLDKFAQFHTYSGTTVVELTPLTFDEVKQLLTKCFKDNNISDKKNGPLVGLEGDDGGLSEKLVQVVLDVSSGNPFWCHTIARHIMENGFEEFSHTIQQSYLTSSAAPGSPNANAPLHPDRKNPLTILILCRLDSLPVAEQLVLKYASIIGEEVSEHELIAVLPATIGMQLDSHMQALVQAGFLYNTEVNSYGFYNHIIRTAISEIIPPSESYAVHEGVARYLEANNSREVELRSHYASLCYHYSLAGPNRVKETYFYCIRAAEVSMESSVVGAKDGNTGVNMSVALNFLSMALSMLISALSSPNAKNAMSGESLRVALPFSPPPTMNDPMSSKTVAGAPSPAAGSQSPAVGGALSPNGSNGLGTIDNILLLIATVEDCIKVLNPGGILSSAVRKIKASFSKGEASRFQAMQTSDLLYIKECAERLLLSHVNYKHSNTSGPIGGVRRLSVGISAIGAALNISANSSPAPTARKSFSGTPRRSSVGVLGDKIISKLGGLRKQSAPVVPTFAAGASGMYHKTSVEPTSTSDKMPPGCMISPGGDDFSGGIKSSNEGSSDKSRSESVGGLSTQDLPSLAAPAGGKYMTTLPEESSLSMSTANINKMPMVKVKSSSIFNSDNGTGEECGDKQGVDGLELENEKSSACIIM